MSRVEKSYLILNIVANLQLVRSALRLEILSVQNGIENQYSEFHPLTQCVCIFGLMTCIRTHLTKGPDSTRIIVLGAYSKVQYNLPGSAVVGYKSYATFC